MSVSTKAKLKALKEALAAKDWTEVERNANGVLEYESSNYNARVFLALALFHRGEYEDSEKNYRAAISSAPNLALARQGLATFFEKRGRWSDYAGALLDLMRLLEDNQEANKYAETLQKLIDVQRTHGTRPELIDALSYLLPNSRTYSLLSTLPPADSTQPLATSFHSVQVSLVSSLPTLLEIISLTEAEETYSLESEINKRRQRLVGVSMSAAETRKAVNAEQLRQSRLPGLYRALLNEPDASSLEDLRRQIELKLLNHLMTLLKSLPSSLDGPTLDLKATEKTMHAKKQDDIIKASVRAEVEELAWGMVVIGVRAQIAWDVELEWNDKFADWPEVNWVELHRYADLFPNTGLARIVLALKPTAPLQVNELSDESATQAVDVTAAIEAGLADSPESILAHTAAAQYFAQEQDWEAVMQISEAAAVLISHCERDIGRALPWSASDARLALSLVYWAPPLHHLRAGRMLDALISSARKPSIDLLTGKAFVLQHAEKWAQAAQSWEQVLKIGIEPEHARVATEGSRAWCLFKGGNIEAAYRALKAVVEFYESRKENKDEWQKAGEKIRSKAEVEMQPCETTAEALERAQSWWRLGQCLWHLREIDPSKAVDAFEAFVASIKAYPEYAPAFTSLGMYYRSLPEPDNECASKCFQKALELDGGEEVAAHYLAEEFASMSDWNSVEVIARRVVDKPAGKGAVGRKNTKRLAWAWKAIGGAELNAKHYTAAIIAFQTALRGADDDVHTWIKLGIAYRLSGKHVAAIKVFAKALEMDSEMWYARFLIADVQRELGLFDPSIESLKTILDDHPDETGIAIVLAETYLIRGLEELSAGYLARAERSLTEALSSSTLILESGIIVRIVWKIVGDSLSGLGKICEPADIMRISYLAERVVKLAENEKVDEKIDIAKSITCKSLRSSIALGLTNSPASLISVAVLAFKMRVLLETQSDSYLGSAWFDLAVGISNTQSDHSDSNTVKIRSPLYEAIRCLKVALRKEPYNGIFWNALGVLSFDLSPRLAQHCFIRAVELNTRNAIPWTNLGLFYLAYGDLELANQSFLKAQTLDSNYTAPWIGQAILASKVGHTRECSMLLEHAFSLGSDTPEVDIAYATHIYQLYQTNAEGTKTSLALPLFAVSRYLARRPADVHALHLNALLLEQAGNLTEASCSLATAAKLLEDLYEVNESPDVEGQFIIAQTNLGRVHLANLEYFEAIAAFESAQNLLDIHSESQGSLTRTASMRLLSECLLGLALSQFWLGEVGSAKHTLKTALEDMKGMDDNFTIRFNLALGRIYWSEGDEDSALSTFLDMGKVINSNSPPSFLMTLFALRIVTGNRVIDLELDRLHLLNPTVMYTPEATRLGVLSAYLSNDAAAALAAVSKTAHATPWSSQSRYMLSTVLSETANLTNSSSFHEAGRRILQTQHLEIEDSVRKSDIFELAAVNRIAKEETEQEGFAMLQKAVHLAPWRTKVTKALLNVKNTKGFAAISRFPATNQDDISEDTW